MVTLFLLVAIMDHPQQGVVAAVGRPRGHEAVVEEGLKPLWGQEPAAPCLAPSSGLMDTEPTLPVVFHLCSSTATPAVPGTPSVKRNCDPARAQGALRGLAVRLLSGTALTAGSWGGSGCPHCCLRSSGGA